MSHSEGGGRLRSELVEDDNEDGEGPRVWPALLLFNEVIILL